MYNWGECRTLWGECEREQGMHYSVPAGTYILPLVLEKLAYQLGLLALINLRWTFGTLGTKFRKKQVALVLVYSNSQVSQGLSMKWEDSNAENTIYEMKNLLLPWLLMNKKFLERH